MSPAIPSMCPTLYAEECYLFVEIQRTLRLSDLKSLSVVMLKQAWYGLFSRLRNYQFSKTSTPVLMGQGSVPLEKCGGWNISSITKLGNINRLTFITNSSCCFYCVSSPGCFRDISGMLVGSSHLWKNM